MPLPFRIANAKVDSSGITGSRIPKLLGYYPTSGTGKEVARSQWQAAAIRFGCIYESIALLHYLKHHLNYKYKEAGFLSITSPDNPTELDGAIPDGILIDTETNVEFVVEFKCRRKTNDVEGSHLAQGIFEMASGPTFPHVDVVTFCERSKKVNGEWETIQQEQEIRLYRSESIERDMYELVRRSAALYYRDFPAFCQLVQTEPYVRMRAHLDTLAVEANRKAKVIPIDPLVESERLVGYKAYHSAHQFADTITSVHPILHRIEQRQSRIFAAYQVRNPRSGA